MNYFFSSKKLTILYKLENTSFFFLDKMNSLLRYSGKNINIMINNSFPMTY